MSLELQTVDDAAIALNLSPQRVREFIRAGRLSARKVGRDYVLLPSDIEDFNKLPRNPGNPEFVKKETV